MMACQSVGRSDINRDRRHNPSAVLSHLVPYPTEHFSIPDPQNKKIAIYVLHKICRSLNFEAAIMGNVQSGCCSGYYDRTINSQFSLK